MNIQIERIHRNADYIDGTLRIDSIDKICDTAEFAPTALKAGTYRVLIHRCKQYHRKMPVLSVIERPCLEGTTAKRSVTGGKMSRLEAATREASVTGGKALGKQPEAGVWLEASTKCERCPKMDFICNNSTLPIYCPQIKIGNGVYNRTDGSIIIGERVVWGALIHSAEHFNRLIDRLDKAQNRGELITVTIEENYEP